jgi:tetratricopeptide (TPR) repeat protein
LGHAYRLTGRLEDAVGIQKQLLGPNPGFASWGVRRELAILYSELGREKEARAEAAEILKLVPNFSVEIYGQRIPYKDPAQAERDMAALRNAGLK